MNAEPELIELIVNDGRHRTAMSGTTMLIHVLRDELDLKGVRAGCAIGECGSCTVLANDTPIRSCITPLSEVGEAAILTPEGLGTPDAPHHIQRTFIEGQAGQCGYCVNGMIMTVAGLEGSGCSSSELRAALDDHLCRCGTHVRLIAAAERALGLSPSTGEAAAAPSGAPVSGVDRSSTTFEAPLPAALGAHPHVEQWLTIGEDGRIQVLAGKVEIGQGIRTAFAQLVASQLGLSAEHVDVVPTRTDRSPDQRFTSGSLSIEEGGVALAYAGAALRRHLLARAAEVLGREPSELAVGPTGVRADGDTTVPFPQLLEVGPITGPITEQDTPDWGAFPIGEPTPRRDLQQKLTGAPAYLHDISMPGMLWARAVLPPTPDARLLEAPIDRVRALPGIIEVLIDGRLIVVVAEHDHQAVRAVEALRRDLRWDEIPAQVPPDLAAAFREAPPEVHPVREDARVLDEQDGPDRRSASYSTPYQAHGSIAPSAAIAHLEGDHLTVWSHTQGVYPLRRELAALFGIEEDRLTVEHRDGPGCYGMNGADDAAAFATFAALALPDRPIRFQFSIQDEFGWEPYGTAMFADLTADLDRRGCVTSWQHRAISDVHKARPNGAGDRLLPAWLRSGGTAGRPWTGPEEGGARNAVPLYDLPIVNAEVAFVRGPLRTSALRCLGAYLNLFATESFMDELAEAAGRDPVEFRLAHLSDERARAVLELAADRAGWTPHVGPSGRGLGVALAHYKDSKTYVAQVASVEIDRATGDFRVERLVMACDAGLVVNPDGLRNQLEGGALQGLSRALYEELNMGPSGVRERDWTSYGTLRFTDVPRVEVHLIDRPGMPPLGAGESATPTVAAAVANALDDAIGIRLRDLPLTAAKLERRLADMDEAETSRVIL